MEVAVRSPRRVLFAGLFHETHTLVEGSTGLADFQVRSGEEMLDCAGDSSPLGGALAAAAELGWEIIPAVDFRATPSGIVEDEVVEMFWREFRGVAEPALASGVDALFLVLHGAMVSRSMPDVEGDLLERWHRLRGAAGIPVFGVVDLHANFTGRMARHANCLVAYRENPHTDARESAVRGIELLEACLSEAKQPRTFWRHPPIVWPPTGTGTATDPMRALEACARELEKRHPAFCVVNVLAGFSFADLPETGVSFTVVTTGAEEEALRSLEALGELAWELRNAGNVVEEAAGVVLRRALAEPVEGLTVLAEPSDNIGGGAPGDGTGLLRAFIAAGVSKAALALADPEAVARLATVSLGSRTTVVLGGRGSRLDAGPLSLEVELMSRSSGRFELADKQSHLASVAGDYFEMGPCAVVRHAGITLLLTSKPTPPMDLGQWTSQGLDPAMFSFIGVKAAVAHRRAYEPIASRLLSVDTPGPCTSRLASLPYRRIARPIFPLDEWSGGEPNRQRQSTDATATRERNQKIHPV